MLRRTFMGLVALLSGCTMGDDNPAWHDQAQTAREKASVEQSVTTNRNNGTVSSGGSTQFDIHSNNSGQVQILEFATGRIDGSFSNDVRWNVQVIDSAGNVAGQFLGHTTNLPFEPDPGIPIKDGGEIDFIVDNGTASSIDVNVSVTFRTP